jgi:hypothetical protein
MWLQVDSPKWIHSIAKKFQAYAQMETHSDPGGAFAMQKIRRKLKNFGFDWLHMLFKPSKVIEPSKVVATELFCRRFGLNQYSLSKQYSLPLGYCDFLKFSNGAFLFGGHLILLGQETEISDFASAAAYEAATLQYANFAQRTPFLPEDMVEIGRYPYSAITLAARGEKIVVSGNYAFGNEKVWDSFELFFNSEFERLEKLLSVDGVIDNPEMVSPFYINT